MPPLMPVTRSISASPARATARADPKWCSRACLRRAPIPGISSSGHRPLGAVRANRETVCLVAQPLQEIEYRIARLERERRPGRQEEPLAPGVAVGTLGDRRDRHVVDAELCHDLLGRAELAQAAIDQ